MKYIENILVLYPQDVYYHAYDMQYSVRGGRKMMYEASAVIHIAPNGYTILKKYKDN